MSTHVLKNLLHFCNINGINSKKREIGVALAFCPRSVFVGFCEAKIDKEKVDKGKDPPRFPGFSAFSFPFTPVSSGVVVYAA